MKKKILFNNPVLKLRRKSLRKSQTEAEEILWNYLRDKRLGIKFFRQYSVGPYILDFYSPAIRLGIELDGQPHVALKAAEKDNYRTRTLGELNIKVIRFWNSDVINNHTFVLEAIKGFLM